MGCACKLLLVITCVIVTSTANKLISDSAINVTCSSHQYPVGKHCCRLCPAHSIQLAPCRPPLETQCRCVVGRWLDRQTQKCHKCSSCESGSGVVRPCSANHDSLCQKCPGGTYSRLSSTSNAGQTTHIRHCIQCTVCRSDQVKIQNCTEHMDTVCMDEAFRLLAEGKARGVVRLRDRQEDDGGKSDSSSGSLGTATALYCSVLASLVFALVLYTGIRCWRMRRHSPHKTSPPHVYVRTVASSPSDHAGVGSGQHGSPADSMVTSEGHSLPGQSNRGMLKDRLEVMTWQERAQLDSALGSGLENQQWRQLASLLGYSSSSVEKLHRAAALKSANPASLLIDDWSKNCDATMTSFVRALTLIGRLDLASLVDYSPIAVKNLANFI